MARFENLPMRDERFYWNDIAGGERTTWIDKASRNASVVASLDHLAEPFEQLNILFHTEMSGLRLVAADFARAIGIILDANEETLWIVPQDRGEWLVEVSRADRETCVLTGWP